jgi:GDP-4-dehydro-6-deoxy-D-mannose reductase
MRVLVTGADGFVGSWLVRALVEAGHSVTGTFRPSEDHRGRRFPGAARDLLAWVPLELADDASVRAVAVAAWDAVVHLAAVSWVREAERSPGRAWNENAGGTARLVRGLAEGKRAGTADPVVLVVSSIEVYGHGGPVPVPRRETDPVAPVSAYAGSKAGAELAALGEWRRTGLRAVVVRPSPHSGPGQGERALIPKYARRILAARDSGSAAITTGLLDGVRDFLHVADVVQAYLVLLEAGVPGEIYNVSSGNAVGLEDVVLRLCALAHWPPILEVEAADVRPDAIRHLVGDSAKLRARTGWMPTRTMEQTLQDVLDDQAN